MNLFNADLEERLPVADADLRFWRHVDFGDEHQLLRRLIDETPWKQERVTVWGKSHLQPRLVAWHGDPDKPYSYSGIQLVPQPWTPLLLDIKANVEDLCGMAFNSVLLNLYRDNRDSMGFHSDDEPELGTNPAIASVSFGEERRFVFKHRHRRDLNDVKIPLPDSSLLLMTGPTQQNWKHGIPKDAKPCGPRVNLTFRRIYQL